jgi:hypothetical protein
MYRVCVLIHDRGRCGPHRSGAEFDIGFGEWCACNPCLDGNKGQRLGHANGNGSQPELRKNGIRHADFDGGKSTRSGKFQDITSFQRNFAAVRTGACHLQYIWVVGRIGVTGCRGRALLMQANRRELGRAFTGDAVAITPPKRFAPPPAFAGLLQRCRPPEPAALPELLKRRFFA